LKYRIDEWHSRNQRNVASDTCTLCTSDFVASHRTLRVSSPSPSTVPPTAETSDLRLPVADRIKAIQCELNQLRNRTSFAPIASQLPHRTSHLAPRSQHWYRNNTLVTLRNSSDYLGHLATSFAHSNALCRP
jgi:hypothetical protein